jgi:peptidoglycan-N-acetylglucosamine deacetylase
MLRQVASTRNQTSSGTSFAPKTPGSPAVSPNKLSASQALAILQADQDLYWQNARREVHRSVRELQAVHQDEHDNGLHYAKLLSGSPRKKEIALTFDDGPHPSYTNRLLAILATYKIPATFFVVGEMAEKHPDLIRAEQSAGMEIGNHTYHHVSLTKIPSEFIFDEIKACGQVIQSITGSAPDWFRPPGGRYDDDVANASQALGYTMALWTNDPGDYNHPKTDILLKRTLDKATSGGIILLHDGIEETIQILPALIETLQKRGYKWVTLDRLKATSR